ncbi:leucyl/phenylalanyl-tRNA--protein transferase [Sulfuriferula sp. AH1]|uniref:leucyl/phenylalanyl-tRNA--protein transferase n=1 Tax=Sulfuriferula sp. AH1 TaxID=1985873 RepID=UPI000B3B2609|nr:leucyl/phenylalanyl-tRNA--protein transferase [Sulfuriferula sp. AH1]ARU31566.1 leucyl/phenylalanyl-tRNA--protein transferase [Sulfuriferula sp. AH1]
MLPWLKTVDDFPPVTQALTAPAGLLAAGGDLSAEWLIGAYSRGIFPWFNADQPILWWSLDPRMVLFPQELRVPHSLKRVMRKHQYEIRVDTAFRQVMEGCSQPRAGQDGTWISPQMIAAYTELHRLGVAHSVETWINGELAGGLYGIALGRVFYGESMFTRVADASKIAFVHLVRQLQRWQFKVIDCQMNTAHLARFGAREIPRADFMQLLAEGVHAPGVTLPWQLEGDLVE